MQPPDMESVTNTVWSVWGLASPTSWALAGICVFLTAFYHYNTCYRGLWEKYGIPVPPAWPVINHWPAFREGEEAPFPKWFKQFGDTFGTYGMIEHDPVLVTRDVKLLKHILVKDYTNYMDRYLFRLTKSSISQCIFLANGNDWLRARHVTSPIFTGGKLRIMLGHVTKSANDLKELLRMYSENRELVPVKQVSGKFASEIIARVGFGINTHSVSKEKSEFAHNAENILRLGDPLQDFANSVSRYFPPFYYILRRLGFKIDAVNEEADDFFKRILKSEIEDRTRERLEEGSTSGSRKPRDMLDMYLDSEVSGNDSKRSDLTSKVLNRDEIIGNINFLILAAFETVSTVLQAVMYHLAMMPGIQQKIIDEVDELLDDDDTDLTYDALRKMTYTEQVINEAMRCQPPVSALVRKSVKPRTYEGITIPGGANIMISISQILKDPRHWGEDPEKFDPDRFSPDNCRKRDPLAFLAFGFGPKECVGKRFAYMELKILLATILKDFRFELSERSEPKIGESVKIVSQNVGFLRPSKPVMVEVVARNAS